MLFVFVSHQEEAFKLAGDCRVRAKNRRESEASVELEENPKVGLLFQSITPTNPPSNFIVH